MNYCPKCNKYVNDDNQQFCADCGTQLTNLINEKMITNDTAISLSNNKTEKKQFGLGVVAGIIVALVIGGAFLFSNKGTENNKNEKLVNSQDIAVTVKPVTKPTVQEKPKIIKKTNLDLAKEYLSQRGYDSSYITATTYGLKDKGFLCYGNKMITVVDIKNSRIGFLLNTKDVIANYKLCRNTNNNSPLLLQFFLGKEARDKDADSGYWENGNHYLPIYALYDFKSDGSMEHGGLYTGEGKNISHYQKYLYEMKNVDIADILLTQLVKLGSDTLNEFPIAKAPSVLLEPQHQQETSTNNNSAVNSRNTFIGFHRSITNKQLRTAFNILSPDYQRFMQSYDQFARGYTTTLRSEVVELKPLYEDDYSAAYAYTLKAVDREGNGQKIQYFAGKVKLIKINGVWRIDSTEAKRL